MREFLSRTGMCRCGSNPNRQQIIIFKPPYDTTLPDYVKRVIALPGETVDVHDGAVWINGKKLEENYTIGHTEPPIKIQTDRRFSRTALHRAGKLLFCDGRQPGEFSRQPILGVRATK